ncbi:DUF2058 domain-containing protein [Neptunicella sp. SCSIO 80796]|uniref:DUF2058 domain-containing protein n=1 Tax=Neptunicella plasticusilytica TaxID=3117012 RepID=UPI003A4E3F0D
MASLQEQLLKAGLADKKKANQISKEKHKQKKAKQHHKVEMTDEAKALAAQQMEQKRRRDQQLNQQAKEKAEQKAILAQIKQLIEVNKQPKGRGDIACNFTDGTKVKQLYVDEKTQKHISQGRLAIVKFQGGYELVPMPVADKIAQRDESLVVYRADTLEQSSNLTEEEQDWYADYEIPDDLNW